jgi:hypothetical protein
MAAFTRLGARKAREIVTLTWRRLHFLRTAISSTFAMAPLVSSSSDCRLRAIDLIRSPGSRRGWRADRDLTPMSVQ